MLDRTMLGRNPRGGLQKDTRQSSLGHGVVSKHFVYLIDGELTCAPPHAVGPIGWYWWQPITRRRYQAFFKGVGTRMVRVTSEQAFTFMFYDRISLFLEDVDLDFEL